jgi:hypothetical protein
VWIASIPDGGGSCACCIGVSEKHMILMKVVLGILNDHAIESQDSSPKGMCHVTPFVGRGWEHVSRLHG